MHKPRQIAAIASRCMKAFGQKAVIKTAVVLPGCTTQHVSFFFGAVVHRGSNSRLVRY